jgi:hypothetical protein
MDISDPNVLNRFGIIANFLAAFLLAPELLGARNILRLDGAITSIQAIIGHSINTITGGGHPSKGRARLLRVQTIVSAVGLLGIFYIMVGFSDYPFIASVISIITLVLSTSIGRIMHGNVSKFRNSEEIDPVFTGIGLNIMTLGSLAVMGLLLFAIGLPGLVFSIAVALALLGIPAAGFGGVKEWKTLPIPLRIMISIQIVLLIPAFVAYVLFAGAISVSIEILLAIHYFVLFGQGRSRGLLISCGIILFVVGSVAQLWATFLPANSAGDACCTSAIPLAN